MAAEAPTLRIRAQFPRKFRFLLEEKARFKVAYGGRAGAKSWQIARALLIRGLAGGLRVLCTREVQSSLKESSMQLLADQIKALGLDAHYKVLSNEIRGPADTLFIFKGLADPEALKSAEGMDICWIEEARNITKASWLKLEPTVRKAGSEIWISFNPELPTDYLYVVFVKRKPPPGSIVVKVSWRDNPWLSQESYNSMMALREADYDEYLWVWEGACKVALEGAVYAKQLRQVQKDGRITKVPVDKTRPVHTFWDLGRGDMTAIWFVQIVQNEYRVVDYYQNNGEDIDHYLEVLDDKTAEHGWFYGTDWLPHDAENKVLGAKRTIKRQMTDAGRRVKIVPKIGVADGIASARAIFPNCWFDEERCETGLDCLRQYHYEVEPDGTRSNKPEHDWSSHGADGFRYMGVALRDDTTPKPKPKPKMRPPVTGAQGWLAR